MLTGQLRSATIAPPNVGFRSTSSSRIVSVTGDGRPAIPWPLAAVADTVTDLSSAASTSSSTAVTVTTPPLAVVPAATVSVALPLDVKSVAAVCDPAAADTVIVVTALEACESAAVTVATPPFPEIESDDSFSVTEGAASSSRIAPVPVAVPSVAFTGPLSATATVSSGSSTPSPVTVTARVLLVSPAANVSVPDASAA